jgi:hypothetical protein
MKHEKNRPTEELKRYFSGQNLTSEEQERVFQYREQCIRDNTTDKNALTATNFYRHIAYTIRSTLINTKKWDHRGSGKSCLENLPIIDLGSGDRPIDLIDCTLKLGAKKYIGVDLFDPITSESLADTNKVNNTNYTFNEVESVQEDALTYLFTVPSDSAVVVSTGTPQVISGDYVNFMINEIRRVTPAGNITVINPAGVLDHNLSNFGFKILDSRILPMIWEVPEEITYKGN